MAYKFEELETTASFTCIHVITRERPILYVSHEREDGFWQFLCGHNEHHDNDYKIISLKEATDLDKSINKLFDMPLGVGADRKSKASEWELFKLD